MIKSWQLLLFRPDRARGSTAGTQGEPGPLSEHQGQGKERVQRKKDELLAVKLLAVNPLARRNVGAGYFSSLQLRSLVPIRLCHLSE